MFIVPIVMFVLCLVIEAIRPGWKQPARRDWPLRVIFLASFELCIVLTVGLAVRNWWQLPSWFDWSDFEPLTGGALAYLCASFFFYWWHRARHECDLLWRIFHQLHHSPARLETLTALYKHPIEALANSLLSASLVYLLFGLDMEGAAWYTCFTLCAQLFVHLNMRTPRWLGFFVQRPEMHRVHHQPGTEHLNYSDLPVWDLLFGTFTNPVTFDGQCGFNPACEERVGDMLRFRDVSMGKTRVQRPRAKIR